MKNQFEIKSFLSENREIVISKYNDLTKERFFNGITLSQFMVQVMNLMVINNPRSEKRASSLLLSLVGQVIVDNSKIEVINDLDKKLSEKYQGTAFMALV